MDFKNKLKESELRAQKNEEKYLRELHDISEKYEKDKQELNNLKDINQIN